MIYRASYTRVIEIDADGHTSENALDMLRHAIMADMADPGGNKFKVKLVDARRQKK